MTTRVVFGVPTAPLPIDDVLPELARRVRRRHERRAAGAAREQGRPPAFRSRCSTRRGCDAQRIVMLEPRRLATRAAARRMASAARRARRRHRRLSRSRRDARRAGDAHRGRHRRDPHAHAAARSVARRRRARDLRRVPRAQPRRRPRARAHARDARRAAPRSARAGHVRDARRRARRPHCSATRPIITSEGRAFPVETRYIERRQRSARRGCSRRRR